MMAAVHRNRVLNRYTTDGDGNLRCPMCKVHFNPWALRDALSLKEAGISSMCQKCQDLVFEAPEDDYEGDDECEC
jgi:hypothetical protein